MITVIILLLLCIGYVESMKTGQVFRTDPAKNIVQLTRSNFTIWKFRMLVFFSALGITELWLNSYRSLTTTTSSSSSSSVGTPEENKEPEKKDETDVSQEPEEQNVKVAYQVMIQSVTEPLLHLVQNVEFNKLSEAWSSIMAYFNSNTRTDRRRRQTEFNQLTMETGASFGEFCGKITREARELNAMGKEVVISEQSKIDVLFNGLLKHHSQHFAVLITILEREKTTTFDDTVNQLTPIAANLEHEGNHKANVTWVQGKIPDPQNRACRQFEKKGRCSYGDKCKFSHEGDKETSKKDVVCHFCKFRGHSTRECRKKKASEARTSSDRADQSKKDKDAAHTANVAKVAAQRKAIVKEVIAEMKSAKFSANATEQVEGDLDWAFSVEASHDICFPFNISSLTIFFKILSMICGKIHDFMFYASLILLTIVFSGLQITTNFPPSWQFLQSDDSEELSGTITLACLYVLLSYLASTALATARFLKQVANGLLAFTQAHVCMVFVKLPRCMKYAAINVTSHLKSWIVDTGASLHICTNLDAFVKGSMRQCKFKVTVANGSTVYGRQMGNVLLRSTDQDGNPVEVLLKDVLYLPGMSYNLVSMSKLVDDGCRASFGIVAEVFFSNLCVLGATLRSKLYYVNASPQNGSPQDGPQNGSANNFKMKMGTNKIDERHRQFGHASEPYLRRLDPSLPKSSSLSPCDACEMGNAQKQSYKHEQKTEIKAEHALEQVSSDLHGPFNTQSRRGKYYFVLIIDIFTRYTFVYFLRLKSDFFDIFTSRFLPRIFNVSGRYPKRFHSDGGGEFTGDDVRNECTSKGIHVTTTNAASSNQNAVVERKIGLVLRACRAMMMMAGLPPTYWEPSVSYAVTVLNLMPHRALLWLSPAVKWAESFNLRAPSEKDLKRFHSFGCLCYAKILDKDLNVDIKARARRCLFLGIGNVRQGFILEDIETGRYVFSRDVNFIDNVFPCADKPVPRLLPPTQTVDQQQSIPQYSTPLPQSTSGLPPSSQTDSVEPPTTPAPPQETKTPLPSASPADSVPPTEPEDPSPRRSTRSWNPSGGMLRSLANLATVLFVVGSTIIDPPSRAAAMLGRYAKQWIGGERRELEALVSNGTWIIVARPKGVKVISCRWVYHYKHVLLEDGHAEEKESRSDEQPGQFKARLVAKGFQQTQGVNYNETFAAVALMKTFRILLALAVTFGWSVYQLDVSSAFLYGVLKETVYMDFPPGYPGPPGMVCLLKKSIYGLKQSSRTWFHTLRAALLKNGFVQLLADTCVFVHVARSLVLSVHVDDIILLAASLVAKEWLVKALLKAFKIKDLGLVSHYLGFEVSFSPGKVHICQESYVQRVLERFQMSTCSGKSTPHQPGVKLLSTSESERPQAEADMEDRPYRSIIGSLLYACLGTRPDIAFAVLALAQFSSLPKLAHWKAAKQVLAYLSATASHGITYIKTGSVFLLAYSDSDWAGCLKTRRSRSGGVILINGSWIITICKLQASISLSSCEAELIALVEVIKEIMWLHNFLGELNVAYNQPTVIYVDNKSAIALAKDPVNHRASKHIDLRYKFMCSQLDDRTIVLEYIPTGDNLADLMTKATSFIVFQKLVGKLVREHP
jgi:histone deacetylase 1/2